MGTNYYLKGPRCPTCGKSEGEAVHIGKSSAGWCFSLHVDDAHPDLDAWRKAWSHPEHTIEDEYGIAVTPAEMEKIVTERSWSGSDNVPHGYSSWSVFHGSNHSEPGPNGLLRHRIGDHCVGHGEGTWDLITGDFS